MPGKEKDNFLIPVGVGGGGWSVSYVGVDGGVEIIGEIGSLSKESECEFSGDPGKTKFTSWCSSSTGVERTPEILDFCGAEIT